ncbi:hypothetical protein BH23PLA1_BH23PLA1_27020 [soil metagenome]
MVRIRMKSFGRRHRPFFRICVMDARTPRDGRAIEELGWDDPRVRNAEAREHLNANRTRYWLSVGAQPTEKVAAILKRHGVHKPGPGEPWELPEEPKPSESPGAQTEGPSVPAAQAEPAPQAQAQAEAAPEGPPGPEAPETA